MLTCRFLQERVSISQVRHFHRSRFQSICQSKMVFHKMPDMWLIILRLGLITNILELQFRLTADGNHVASISSIGTATSVNSNLSVGATAAFPSSRNLMASPLQITTSSGAMVSFEPKQGMMAGNIASSLTAEIKAYGLEARASNRLELFDISNGNIQFDLMGNNSSGVSISAAVTNGDTNALVDEINKNSEVTGIQAFRSGSGAVILQKDDGNDIAITNVTTANNSNFLARQLDDFGEGGKSFCDKFATYGIIWKIYCFWRSNKNNKLFKF